MPTLSREVIKAFLLGKPTPPDTVQAIVKSLDDPNSEASRILNMVSSAARRHAASMEGLDCTQEDGPESTPDDCVNWPANIATVLTRSITSDPIALGILTSAVIWILVMAHVIDNDAIIREVASMREATSAEANLVRTPETSEQEKLRNQQEEDRKQQEEEWSRRMKKGKAPAVTIYDHR